MSDKFKIPLYRLILQWINRAAGYIGSFGEVQLEPEKWRLIGHDGVTPGGIPLKTDIDDVIRAAVVAKTGSFNDLKDKPTLDFQPYDDDLTAIAQLAGAGLLRKIGENIWELDTTEYISGSPWTAEIAQAIAYLVDSSPATLDTLNELAAALGDDPNFATTITNLIASKQAQLNGQGFVKVNGTTIIYDNSTYLTAITKAMVEAVLTGEITSHSHAASEGDHKVAFHDNQNLVGYLNSAYYNIAGGVITPKHDDTKADLAGADFTGPITCTHTISAYDFPLTTSDKREKRNIKKIDNLDRFANVRFKQFRLRRNSKVHYGVIAQEVEQFAPELVSTDASGQKSVSYIEILIAKVALLEREIEQLKAK